MGCRVLLIAVRGKHPATIHREYGVAPTGRRVSAPDAPVVGATLPGGGYLLWVNGRPAPEGGLLALLRLLRGDNPILPSRRLFARLSRGAELVACYVNETVASSSACGWADGAERWSVAHSEMDGLEHLDVSGEPPAELRAIRARQFYHQALEDGGLRYDADIPGAGPDPWEVLERR